MSVEWPAPVKLSRQRTLAVRRSLQAGKVLFRGVRESGRPSDPGDLGIGTYYSSWRALAKCYGKLTTAVIRLRNPYIVSNDIAYELIAENFMTCRGTHERRLVGATAATRMLKCLGFDGLVSVNPNRKKDWEIVVFP